MAVETQRWRWGGWVHAGKASYAHAARVRWFGEKRACMFERKVYGQPSGLPIPRVHARPEATYSRGKSWRSQDRASPAFPACTHPPQL